MCHLASWFLHFPKKDDFLWIFQQFLWKNPSLRPCQPPGPGLGNPPSLMPETPRWNLGQTHLALTFSPQVDGWWNFREGEGFARSTQHMKLKGIEFFWLVVWTNPFEKYARQIGNLPQFSGWKLKKYLSCHHLVLDWLFRKSTIAHGVRWDMLVPWRI